MTTSATPRRIAAVDIGSNTIHLIIAEVGAQGANLRIIDRMVDLARLGADVAALGEIGAARAELACATLRQMADRAHDAGATRMLGLATEGVRAARNAEAIIAQFSAALGTPIALITGMEEAALTFWGATSAIPPTLDLVGVGDLGGGSCEIVTGTPARIHSAASIPLGSGRLIDAVKLADPPTADDFARLKQQADATLQSLATPDPPLSQMIAVGGSATALARFAGKREGLDRADLARAEATLGAQSVTTLAAQTGIDSDRLRLFIGGVVAWQAIMTRLGVDHITVSERGVREGAVIAWSHAGDQWVEYAHAATVGL